MRTGGEGPEGDPRLRLVPEGRILKKKVQADENYTLMNAVLAVVSRVEKLSHPRSACRWSRSSSGVESRMNGKLELCSIDGTVLLDIESPVNRQLPA